MSTLSYVEKINNMPITMHQQTSTKSTKRHNNELVNYKQQQIKHKNIGIKHGFHNRENTMKTAKTGRMRIRSNMIFSGAPEKARHKLAYHTRKSYVRTPRRQQIQSNSASQFES